MLNFNDFKRKKLAIDSKIKVLKKQKLLLKMNKLNQQKTDISKQMNTFQNGPSAFKD